MEKFSIKTCKVKASNSKSCKQTLMTPSPPVEDKPLVKVKEETRDSESDVEIDEEPFNSPFFNIIKAENPTQRNIEEEKTLEADMIFLKEDPLENEFAQCSESAVKENRRGDCGLPEEELQLLEGTSGFHADLSPEDLLIKILHSVKDVKTCVLRNCSDIERISSALCAKAPGQDVRLLRVLNKPFNDKEDLQAFCQRLANDNSYRELVVAFFASLGGKDVTDLARNILDRLMTTSLMMQFNMLGGGSHDKKGLLQMPMIFDTICTAASSVWTGEKSCRQLVKKSLTEHLRGAKRKFKRQKLTKLKNL